MTLSTSRVMTAPARPRRYATTIVCVPALFCCVIQFSLSVSFCLSAAMTPAGNQRTVTPWSRRLYTWFALQWTALLWVGRRHLLTSLTTVCVTELAWVIVHAWVNGKLEVYPCSNLPPPEHYKGTHVVAKGKQSQVLESVLTLEVTPEEQQVHRDAVLKKQHPITVWKTSDLWHDRDWITFTTHLLTRFYRHSLFLDGILSLSVRYLRIRHKNNGLERSVFTDSLPGVVLSAVLSCELSYFGRLRTVEDLEMWQWNRRGSYSGLQLSDLLYYLLGTFHRTYKKYSPNKLYCSSCVGKLQTQCHKCYIYIYICRFLVYPLY